MFLSKPCKLTWKKKGTVRHKSNKIYRKDHLPPGGWSIKLVFDIKGAKSIERETPTVSFNNTHEFANLELENTKMDLTVK